MYAWQKLFLKMSNNLQGKITLIGDHYSQMSSKLHLATGA